jgi:hypothetical protein
MNLAIGSIAVSGPASRWARIVYSLGLATALLAPATARAELFAEYRFTHVEPEFEDSGGSIKFDLYTHHGSAGIGFSF